VCDSGVIVEGKESKEKIEMTDEKTSVEATAVTVTPINQQPTPPAPALETTPVGEADKPVEVDSQLVEMERQSHLKDKKMAEQSKLIEEYSDKMHTLETDNVELAATVKSRDAEIEEMSELAKAKDEKTLKEFAELKKAGRENASKLEDGFKKTLTRLENEIDALTKDKRKAKTVNIDLRKELLDIRNDLE